MPGLVLVSSLTSFGTFTSGATTGGGGVKLEGCEGVTGTVGDGGSTLVGAGTAGVDDEFPIFQIMPY